MGLSIERIVCAAVLLVAARASDPAPASNDLLAESGSNNKESLRAFPTSANEATNERYLRRTTAAAGKLLSEMNNNANDVNNELHYYQERELEEFSVPFTLSWRMDMSGADREPTQDEYLGVVQVTLDWLNEAAAGYYEDWDIDFSYLDTTCEIVPEETSWDPNADDGYPHKMQLNCNANFNAEEMTELPSSNDFIWTINDDFEFEGFMQEYLWYAPPEDSIFRSTQRVFYSMASDGVGPQTGLLTPKPPTPTASADASPPMPAPSVSSPTVPTGAEGSAGTFVAPFALEWQMAVQSTSEDRQPTQEEYDGMLQATIDWFTNEMDLLYANQSEVFTVNQFVASLDPAPTYDAAGGDYTHIIPMECFAIFNAQSLPDVPTVGDLLQHAAGFFDMTLYLTGYLRSAEPEDSIFRSVNEVRYTSRSTTPAGPATPAALLAPSPTDTDAATAPSTPGPTEMVLVDAPAPTTLPPTPTPSVQSPTDQAPAPDMAENSTTEVASAPTVGSVVSGSFPTIPPYTQDGVITREINVEWKLSIGYGIPDRQPQMEEYEGFVFSTEAWLTKTYETLYDNFVRLQSEILTATYNTSMTPPHMILLRTLFVFEGDEGIVPTQAELMRALEDADLMDYMLNHLHTSQPEFNVFTGTNSVYWSSGPYAVPLSSSTGPPDSSPPVQSSPPQSTPSPSMPPKLSPSPSTMNTMPTNDNSSGAGGSADLSNLATVPMVLTMGTSVDVARVPDGRELPKDEDWDSFLGALKKFLTDKLVENFEEDANAVFVGLQNMAWISKEYRPTRTFQYGGRLRFDIAFTEGSTVLSSSAYWNIINKFNFQSFLRRYLWVEPPADSLFHDAVSSEWNFYEWTPNAQISRSNMHPGNRV